MNPQHIVAIVCIVLVPVFSLILYFVFKRNWKIACIFLGIVLSLLSAYICLTFYENTYDFFLIGITILEDMLAVIFIYLTKKLKVNVSIVLWVLSLTCLVTAIVLVFVPCKRTVCKILSGFFFNTALSLITVILADMLKRI
ncbi:unnamed protein product [Trichobilharzia szidati]|nr:unnamed protein product [Trichobilharzia szidati]